MTEPDNPLGEFLRARRELVDPASLGLGGTGRRRVAGLRRDEVAFLAGVSSYYYARLEQGRDRNPSLAVLQAIGRVLDLDEEALAHLSLLVGPAPVRRRSRPRRAEQLPPGLAILLEQWSDQPALVVGRYRDVLAATALAGAVNPGFAAGDNLLRHTFLDPGSREIYADWDDVAVGAVAGLRASAGVDLDDPRLTDLVGELSLKSDDFRRIWARHDVHEKTEGVKRFVSPTVGELALRYATFGVNAADGQTLFVFFAEPGSAAEQSLALLRVAVASTAGPSPAGEPAARATEQERRPR